MKPSSTETIRTCYKLKPGFFKGVFWDPIRVPRISENCHRVLRIRESGFLQDHTGYLTFSLKKLWNCNYIRLLSIYCTVFNPIVVKFYTFLHVPVYLMQIGSYNNIDIAETTMRWLRTTPINLCQAFTNYGVKITSWNIISILKFPRGNTGWNLFGIFGCHSSVTGQNTCLRK